MRSGLDLKRQMNFQQLGVIDDPQLQVAKMEIK